MMLYLHVWYSETSYSTRKDTYVEEVTCSLLDDDKNSSAYRVSFVRPHSDVSFSVRDNRPACFASIELKELEIDSSQAVQDHRFKIHIGDRISKKSILTAMLAGGAHDRVG